MKTTQSALTTIIRNKNSRINETIIDNISTSFEIGETIIAVTDVNNEFDKKILAREKQLQDLVNSLTEKNEKLAFEKKCLESALAYEHANKA